MQRRPDQESYSGDGSTVTRQDICAGSDCSASWQGDLGGTWSSQPRKITGVCENPGARLEKPSIALPGSSPRNGREPGAPGDPGAIEEVSSPSALFG